MILYGVTFLVVLVAAGLLDAQVGPSGVRRPVGSWLLGCMMTALLGLFLLICGNVMVAAALTLAMLALLVLASNAKQTMLGEPLLFSDLALVGAIFQHPQFYLSAVSMWQRGVAAVVAVVLMAVLAWLFVTDVWPHIAGALLVLAAGASLAVSIALLGPQRLAPAPMAWEDTRQLGLMPALLVYWLRWRESENPPVASPIVRKPVADPPALLVVIQCESFADPVELFAQGEHALPGLSSARAQAWQWGNLHVSGFGAYTMRTEYGVLFGREEEELGFRRYDPFLTAFGETSYALPRQLNAAGWKSQFVHPHDMRFYGRDRIMPASGFARLVGQSAFAQPSPAEGRYVTDAAMTDVLEALARKGAQSDVPTMLYAVTIENHGPWAPDSAAGANGLVPGYLRLVRNSDAMLTDLTHKLCDIAADSGRPAMLVFFGDHRPSIPGITAPGGARHTPYVMLRSDRHGCLIPGCESRIDRTPAQLHHAILAAVLGEPVRV